MLHFCTLCDKNFLLKGLALHRSLKKTIRLPFKLYWLCIDAETYDALVKINLPEIVPFALSALEAEHLALAEQKEKQLNSKYGSPYENYVWSLTPFFVNYLLYQHFIEPNEKLTYIDSDIYFYRSPEIILNTVGTKTIGLHTHRFGCPKDKKDKIIAGWYNVGVVVFTKNDNGLKISDLWSYWVFNQDNEYYKQYGTCGDQKYLELFEEIIGLDDVCVFDEHPQISHRAPWCVEEDSKPVVFFHFSHFTHNFEKDFYSDSRKGEWNPTKFKHIHPYYDNYWLEIKELNRKYNLMPTVAVK